MSDSANKSLLLVMCLKCYLTFWEGPDCCPFCRVELNKRTCRKSRPEPTEPDSRRTVGGPRSV
jgi:hypothetical protein